jgi:hypothetical protein
MKLYLFNIKNPNVKINKLIPWIRTKILILQLLILIKI